MTPTQDWSIYERSKPLPPFTEADFADPRDDSPFKRDDWERLVEGTVSSFYNSHDSGAHGARRHPWCTMCVIRDWDFQRDTFSPQRPVYDDCLEEQQNRMFDEAEAVAMARVRWWMVRHNGKLPELLDVDDDAQFEDEYLTRDQLENLPQAEPMIERILPRHAYGILRGRDHSFKTFVALDWALCLATGRPWQHHLTERTKVLYIAGEGAHGLSKRVDAWEAANGVRVDDESFVVRKSALSLFKPGAAFSHLINLIEEGQFGLVIIDTLRRVSGSADGNGSDMGAVVDNIDRIKRATSEGSVLVIAHTDKGDNDSRGYSGIEDDADVVWHAKRDEMNVDLHNTKMKDGPDDFHIHLRARATLESLALEAGMETASTTTESQAQILQAFISSFPEGAYGAQLMEASGVPKTTFYRALGELRSGGHVINTGTSKRPFYERVRNHESPQVPSEETPPDLQDSHESHESQAIPAVVPRVPPPLRVGLGTGDGTELANGVAS